MPAPPPVPAPVLASLPLGVQDVDLRRVAARLTTELAGVSVLAMTESEPMGSDLGARLAEALAKGGRRVLVVDGGREEGNVANPARLGARLRGLTRDADLVVLQTPSARSGAGRQLAALAEGVLLIAPVAAKQEVNVAAGALVQAGARLVGVVLTERP